jgi:hypothetical protein
MAQFTPPSDFRAETDKAALAPYKNQDQMRGYNIGTFEYPEGLRVKPDLQHYVAFYINVREKSTQGKKAQDSNHLVSAEEQKRVNDLNANSSRITQAAAEAGVTTFKDNSGKIVAAGTFLASLGMRSKIFDSLKRAAIAGAGARLITTMIDKMNYQPFSSGSTLRLKEIITLHVEERPSVKYGVNYGDMDMGALTGMLIEGSAAATRGALGDMSKEIQARFLSELVKLPQLGNRAGGTLNDLRELSSRTKTNPFREVLFESVDYRTFNFRYKFFPKNKSESQKVFKIIETLKKHMHPELTAGKLFYIYPSEFDIQYFFKDKENNYINKFAKCALTDMSVDYGGDQFATFEDGAPVEVGMNLTFKELEQMTSEGIEKNGY